MKLQLKKKTKSSCKIHQASAFFFKYSVFEILNEPKADIARAVIRRNNNEYDLVLAEAQCHSDCFRFTTRDKVGRPN